MITPELQKYYEDRFEMTSSEGWKDLIEDVERMLNNYQTIDSANSETELYFRKGQVDILKWIVNLREISIKAYEELAE